MLSKKMAFSLMSLITIFALAFVASPALAQFGVTLTIADDNGLTGGNAANNGDVSAADGVQVERDAVVINVEFDKVVNFRAGDPVTTPLTPTYFERDDIDIVGYNMFGGTVTVMPIIVNITPPTAADGRNFMVTIPSQGAAAVRVIVAIKKDSVELADPRAELDDKGVRKAAGKNKAGHIEFHYVHSDIVGGVNEAAPDVYSIVRAGSVLRPVTEATFDVIITLSEEPRKDGFKKDQIDVSNATAADPVLLRKYTDDTVANNGVITENSVENLVETGRDNMIYEYVVTITPKYENKDDIVVKVKSFLDQEKPSGNAYTPQRLVLIPKVMINSRSRSAKRF